MTKADAARLVSILVAAYPNYDKFRDADAVAATVGLWASMFADDDGAIVALALNKHVATSKWPPSVAEIRELMLEIEYPNLVPPDRAWLAVSDLIFTAGEFNHGNLQQQLPPLVARAVEAIGWSTLWELHRGSATGTGTAGADRLAFMQQYGPMYERAKLRAMTPARLTAQIDAAAAKIPGNACGLLALREQERRDDEERDRRLVNNFDDMLLEHEEQPRLTAGETERE